MKADKKGDMKMLMHVHENSFTKQLKGFTSTGRLSFQPICSFLQ